MGTMVIYDGEEGYVQRLAEYISDKKGLPFKVIAFNKEEELKAYIKKKHVDIALISEEFEDIDILKQNSDKIIIFSNGDTIAENMEDSVIYKYQSAENILREIMNCYAQTGKERGIALAMNRKNVQIIGIYSPVGRSGKTSFALTLGQVLAKEGAVLYMNMEEFSGFGMIFSKDYECDLSDLMYFYRQMPGSIGVKLKAIVENFHGMDYIPPMIYSGDIRNIKSEYWVKMISDIAATGMYDHIILDMSNMPRDVFELLEMCTTVYMPLDNDRISMCKISEYEQFLVRADKEEIINKTVKIKVPYKEMDDWNEACIEQLLWGEMGEFVRKIVKEEVA